MIQKSSVSSLAHRLDEIAWDWNIVLRVKAPNLAGKVGLILTVLTGHRVGRTFRRIPQHKDYSALLVILNSSRPFDRVNAEN